MRQLKAKGFTLIEMMIALSIFSALMTLIMLGYSQGLSLWQRGQGQASQAQSLEYRYGLLDDLFIQAQVTDYDQVSGIFVPYYHGDPQSLRFMTRSPILDLPGRVHPVELALEQSEDDLYSYDLVYKEASRYSDPIRGISWKNASKQILLEDIKGAYFEHEAAAASLPEDLALVRLSSREKNRYREKAEYLEAFNSDWMWRIPQSVRFNFIDSNGQEHHWTFPMPTTADTWSLEIYAVD